MLKENTVGRCGEDVACEYLKKHGYIVLQRNERSRWGEIDIIAKQRSTSLLVFFEVKALTAGDNGLLPEDNYTWHKSRKTIRACQLFAGKHPTWFKEEIGWQIDLLAITIYKIPIEDSEQDCEIRHYENV